MRALSFLLLCILSIFTPLPLFFFASLFYVFVWTGYELLIITVFVDSFFGFTTTSYMYTLTMSVLLLATELLRPYLSWYTTRV